MWFGLFVNVVEVSAMAKFKVGDKVTVRKDLIENNEYKMENGEIWEAERDMIKFKGKKVTISLVGCFDDYYELEEDEMEGCANDN